MAPGKAKLVIKEKSLLARHWLFWQIRMEQRSSSLVRLLDRELFRLCCHSLAGLGSLEEMSRMELMLGGRAY